LLQELEVLQQRVASVRLLPQELAELPVRLALQVLRQEPQEALQERELMEQQEPSEA
jgi:hypothetical protein